MLPGKIHFYFRLFLLRSFAKVEDVKILFLSSMPEKINSNHKFSIRCLQQYKQMRVRVNNLIRTERNAESLT